MLQIIIAVVIVAIAALAVGIRLIPVRAEAQHVDPAIATAPTSPNFVLLQGDAAPTVPLDLAQTADRLAAAISAQGGRLLAGDLTDGFASYVFRSRVFGFPDVASIRLNDASDTVRVAEGAVTEVQIFSRALMGYSDMGVNQTRVDRLLAALDP